VSTQPWNLKWKAKNRELWATLVLFFILPCMVGQNMSDPGQNVSEGEDNS
jgi:hypothetical protein